jgi:hypothetical protein
MRREGSEATRGEATAEKLARLRAEHSELEGRLQELDRYVYLTPDEQFERKRIQKLKLRKKDEIARLTQSD